MATPMHQVSSSNISFVGYDNNTQELYIVFKNGNTYKYDNVSEKIFEEFKDSSSVGSYYHQNIKGKYTSIKM